MEGINVDIGRKAMGKDDGREFAGSLFSNFGISVDS